MRTALRRRLAVLEGKPKPAKAVNNLDAEIRVMTTIERGILRDFLLFLKSGGQPDDEKFDELKIGAEEAISTARSRLNLASRDKFSSVVFPLKSGPP